jgi:hypothetical protein
MPIQSVTEHSTASYSCTLLDHTNQPIPGPALSSLTLTLYDRVSDAVLNGRDNQDVLNANDVTVDGNGVLTWLLQPADTAMHDSTLGSEVHVALFTITWPGGHFHHEVSFHIQNLHRV